jgi:hypothetical protein
VPVNFEGFDELRLFESGSNFSFCFFNVGAFYLGVLPRFLLGYFENTPKCYYITCIFYL